MEKEFEALEDLKNYLFNKWKQNHINFGCDYKLEAELEKQLKNLDPINQALTELKAIKEAQPSEALKELEQNIKDRIILAEDRQLKLCATIKQTLLKAQENEKELVDVEKVKSGKTIIHIGKDLVMMNKAKYYEYLELEEEPVSKRILQAKCEEQEKVLEILKPLCEVVETPVKKIRYLKINGVVVYTFKSEEEFNLLKRWSEKCH